MIGPYRDAPPAPSRASPVPRQPRPAPAPSRASRGDGLYPHAPTRPAPRLENICAPRCCAGGSVRPGVQCLLPSAGTLKALKLCRGTIPTLYLRPYEPPDWLTYCNHSEVYLT